MEETMPGKGVAVSPEKRCRRCCKLLPLSAFGKHSHFPDGIRSRCKDCEKVYRLEHRDHENALTRERYHRNHASHLAYQRNWNEENRDKKRAYGREYDRLHRAERSTRWKQRRDSVPEAYRAKNAVNNAIKAGTLAKPSECDSCGQAAPLHAHHHKGYDVAQILDVMWLCPACHGRAHRRDLVPSSKNPQ